jgi:hypothetical protein
MIARHWGNTGLKYSDELADVWALAAPFFDTKSRVLLRPLGVYITDRNMHWVREPGA